MPTLRTRHDGLVMGEALQRQWPWFLLGTGALLLAYAQALGGMVRDWFTDANASHGFLVPLLAGYLVWMQRSDLARVPVTPANAGFGLSLLAAAMFLAGSLTSEWFTLRTSFLVALAGCILFWLGWETLKTLRVPLLYLLFMIPLPAIVINAVAMPLQLFVSRLAAGLIKLLGIPVVRDGNVISLPNIALEVVEACSGLRSLESLLALATAYALVMHRSRIGRLTLIVAAVPIAIGANALRVATTALLARHYGAAAAQGTFHEFEGLFIFALALTMLVGVHVALRKLRL